MPDFYYEGISREGEKIKGEIFADNELDLRVKLRTQKIRPLKIKQNVYVKSSSVELKASKSKESFSNTELQFFVKELLVMFRAGLTITQALDVLASESKNRRIAEVSTTIKTYMESGMTFSQALSRFPKYFDNLFLNVVASGELRGNLEYVLSEWVDYFKKDNNIIKTVHKTILYPLAISAIVITSLLIVVVGIAPIFVHIYRTYGQAMPASLLTISAIGDLVRVNFFFFMTLLTIIALGFILAIRANILKLGLENFIVRAPFISRFFREVYTLRSILVINLALNSGLSLQRALELASEKITNNPFEECLLRAREAAAKGEAVSPFLAKSGLIRPMIVQVFSVGELMSSLPEMLKESIDYLFEEIKKTSHFFSSIMEPVILILGGILIGGLLTSFFIPLFTILSKIQ